MARILIIDDEELVRYAMRKALEIEGYDVTEAENGKAGVTLHEEQPFDLIITDILMPEQEGLETIDVLKKQYPNQKIIAVSGGGRLKNYDYLEVAQMRGVEAVLRKPFSNEELLDCVNERLN